LTSKILNGHIDKLNVKQLKDELRKHGKSIAGHKEGDWHSRPDLGCLIFHMHSLITDSFPFTELSDRLKNLNSNVLTVSSLAREKGVESSADVSKSPKEQDKVHLFR
jgi:hypothetical protein